MYAESVACYIGDDIAGDEAFAEVADVANRFEDAISETAAEGMTELAVKVFLLYRDSHRGRGSDSDPR